jgi:hypothetical protein
VTATPDTSRADDLADDLADEETPETEEQLRLRVLSLARGVSRLAEEGEDEEIEDPGLAERLALTVKPYVDRLVSLKRLLNPVDRIITKREQIEELRGEIADDLATVEGQSESLSTDVPPDLVNDLQAELAAVRRDRKLFVETPPEETEGGEPDEAEEPVDEQAKAKRPWGKRFLDRPVEERMRLILGPRYIGPDRLAEIFGDALPDEEAAAATKRLEGVWEGLMLLPSFGEHTRREQLAPLRQALVDYVLVYRSEVLPVDGESGPCCIERLKHIFRSRFVGSSGRSLWYADLPFYREPLAEGHWALVDRKYLNCTFKQPKIRLVMYARANDLPPEAVRQKSVLEEVYDRVVVDAGLDEMAFDNCNSMTRTSYQQKDEPSKKAVYVYYRDGQIRISGKRGVPHWRPGKPRWPAVLPSILFDQAA